MTLVDTITVETNPDVQRAAARLRKAYLVHARTAPAYQTKAYAAAADTADPRVAAILGSSGGDARAVCGLAKPVPATAAPKSGAH